MSGMKRMTNELFDDIMALPAIDCHTHLDSRHPSARGLHDVMLYHMMVSELYSAGCPSGMRMSDEPTGSEKEQRIIESIPYLRYIENTSCYYLFRMILKDLYDWRLPVTLENWRELDQRIIHHSCDPHWPGEVMARASVIRAGTELPLRGDGQYDDMFFYALEWAFFTRNQWGVFDSPLFELEYAWQHDRPTRPLPVMLKHRSAVARQVRTVDDVKNAMAHYVQAIPFDQIRSTAHHISTDMNYRHVSDNQMQAALDRREQAGEQERDIYASYLFEVFLNELEKSNSPIVFQFSLGAEPLPFETDSRLNPVTLRHLGEIIARHPAISFQCFLSVRHANQSLCSMCRELPNLSLAGYWWHNFYPSHIRAVIDERLDMLPMNKQIGFFSDAYCVDWLYAKSKLVRRLLAEVLSDRIVQGRYSREQAIGIAGQILKDSPASLLGLDH